jgi:hypothetical protein
LSYTFTILYNISIVSDVLPILSFMFIYKNADKPFRTFLFILLIGLVNDTLGYFRDNLGISRPYLIINDIHEVVTFALLLRFFFLLNNQKFIRRYYIVFCIGILFQLIDWMYISKFKINSIYADLFFYSVYSYLCLDKINYQIINGKKSSTNRDWLLIFMIAICALYSYNIFTLALYGLNLPLQIKLPGILYNVLLASNIIVNATLGFVIFKLFHKQQSSLIQ